MAAIIEFQKPVMLGGVPTGANHAFLLLQNDAGQFADIARGGPQSAAGGSGGLQSEGSNPGYGYGSIVTNVEPYSGRSGTPAANDFFTPEQLANLPSRTLLTGTDAEMRGAKSHLFISQF
jgi:hypothetical protein